MDINTSIIHRAAADSQRQELMLYIFGQLSLSHIFENEAVLTAFRGFIQRASDSELSKVSLIKKKVITSDRSPTPNINTRGATTIITGCIDTLSTIVDPQNFWQKKIEVFEQSSTEKSPIRRFKRINNALSKVDVETGFINRILKILLAYEYENVLLEYKARYSEATALGGFKDVNTYMTSALNISRKKLTKLRSEASKYLDLIRAFGPGILFVLGGTKHVWQNLSKDACIVVVLYLKTHLHKVVELATSLNIQAAIIILKGMRLGGTNISILKFKETNFGSIILNHISVLHDGTLETKKPAVSIESEMKHWDAVENIHYNSPTSPSSRESTPADDGSSTATPEAPTDDSDTAPTPTECNPTFSPSETQPSENSLSTFNSRGRKNQRQTEPVCAQTDIIDNELFCGGGRSENAFEIAPSCDHFSEGQMRAPQPDLTEIVDDANQTASRKRCGGTDTRQSEKRVKRGRAKQAQRERRPSSHHESSSSQQGLNESDESRPQRPRTESGTTDEAIAASTYDPSTETHTDPFSAVQVSIAATEESPDPPVNTGEDAISTTESTSEVDGSTDTTSSEATFLTHDSISGETPNHWTVGVGLDCNLRFQSIDHEPSIEQAASVLYAIQNQEACSRISQSLPQSFEALGQPIQQLQQSETTQSFDLYDQVPLATDLTQPLAERTVQDGAQSYVTCGSQGFEEIDFDTRQQTDPHGFDAISFDSQNNAWFENDSQGFEQVSFNAQNRIWQPAPWQGFECMAFNEAHPAMSW